MKEAPVSALTEWTFIPLPQEEQFAFVKSDYWDAHGSLSEDPCDELLDMLPDRFHECSGSHYETELHFEQGVDLLRSLGLREVAKPSDW